MCVTFFEALETSKQYWQSSMYDIKTYNEEALGTHKALKRRHLLTHLFLKHKRGVEHLTPPRDRHDMNTKKGNHH